LTSEDIKELVNGKINDVTMDSLFYGDYQVGNMNEFEREIIKTLVMNFRGLDTIPSIYDASGNIDTAALADYIASNAKVRLVEPDRAEISVPIDLKVLYRASVFPKAKDEGVFDATGIQIIPPANGIVDDGPSSAEDKYYRVTLHFFKEFHYDNASDKWYIIGENGNVDTGDAMPNDLNVPVIFFADLTQFNGEDVIAVGTSLVNNDYDGNHGNVVASDYKVVAEVLRVNDDGSVEQIGPDYIRDLMYFGNGKYGIRKVDLLGENFPFYGMFRIEVAIVKLTGTDKLDVRNIDYYNEFNSGMDDSDLETLKNELMSKFVVSMEAIANPDWEQTKGQLETVTVDGFDYAPVQELHHSIHNNIDDFMAVVNNTEAVFLDMIDPNTAMLHVEQVKWSGVYKVDMPGDISTSDGTVLIPSNPAGASLDWVHPSARLFVRVFDANGNSTWKIAGFNSMDKPDLVEEPGLVVDGYVYYDDSEQVELFKSRVYYGDGNSSDPTLMVNIYDVSGVNPVRITDGQQMNPVEMPRVGDDGAYSDYQISREDIFGSLPEEYYNKPLDVVFSHVYNNKYYEFRMPYMYGNNVMDEIYQTQRIDPDPSAGPDPVSWPINYYVRHGFADNGNVVTYIDFGPVANVDALNEAYVLIDSNSVPLPLPVVFAHAPHDGSGLYSDFAILHYVEADGVNFEDPSFIPYKSVAEIQAAESKGDVSIADQDKIVVVPIVPEGSAIWLDGGSQIYPTPGYYDGKRVSFFFISLDITGNDKFAGIAGTGPLSVQKFYGFYDVSADQPMIDQEIFQYTPGEANYSPIVQTYRVDVDSNYQFGTYTTQQQVDESDLTVTTENTYRHMSIIWAGDPGQMNGVNIERVNGVDFVPNAEPPVINMSAYKNNVEGVGFGPWSNVADKFLYFGTPDTAPIRLISNQENGWNDTFIEFGNGINWDEFKANYPNADWNMGVMGALFVGDPYGKPLSNFVGVVVKNEEFKPDIEIVSINGNPVSSNMVPPFLLDDTSVASVEGGDFGDISTSGADRVLIWREYDVTNQMPTQNYVPLLFNDDDEWDSSSLTITPDKLSYIHKDVPGFIAIVAVGSDGPMIDAVMSNSIPVFVPSEIQKKASIYEVNGVDVSNLSADAPEIDLTGKNAGDSIVVTGDGFGGKITDTIPTIDIVFISGDGQVIPLYGNNLDGWTNSQFTITLASDNMPQGHGILLIRDLTQTDGDGYISNPVPVKFAGGVEIVANIDEVDDSLIHPIVDGREAYIPEKASTETYLIKGSGFVPSSNDVTFYMYFLDQPDTVIASVKLELANSSEAGWTANEITVPADRFKFHQAGGVLYDANNDGSPDGDSGIIVILDGPLGVGKIVSNIALVTFSDEDVPTINIESINGMVAPGEFDPPLFLGDTDGIEIVGSAFGAMETSMPTAGVYFKPNNGLPPIELINNVIPEWNDGRVVFAKPKVYGTGVIYIERNGGDEFSNVVPVNMGQPPVQFDELNGVDLSTLNGDFELSDDSLELSGSGFGEAVSAGEPATRVLAIVVKDEETGDITGYPIVSNDDEKWSNVSIVASGLPSDIPAGSFAKLSLFNINNDGSVDYQSPIVPGIPVVTPYPIVLYDANPSEVWANADDVTVATVTGVNFQLDRPMVMFYVEFPVTGSDEPTVKIPLAKNAAYTGTVYQTTGGENWAEDPDDQINGMFPPFNSLPREVVTSMTGYGFVTIVDVSDEADPVTVSNMVPLKVNLGSLDIPNIYGINNSPTADLIGPMELELGANIDIQATKIGDGANNPATFVVVYQSDNGGDPINVIDNSAANQEGTDVSSWVYIDPSLGGDDSVPPYTVISYLWGDNHLNPSTDETGVIYIASADDLTSPLSNSVPVKFVAGTSGNDGGTSGSSMMINSINGVDVSTSDISIPSGGSIQVDGSGFGEGNVNPETYALMFRTDNGDPISILKNDSEYDWHDTQIFYAEADNTFNQPAGTHGYIYVASVGDPDTPVSNVVPVIFVEDTASANGITSINGEDANSTGITLTIGDNITVAGNGFGAAVTEETLALVFEVDGSEPISIVKNNDAEVWIDTQIYYNGANGTFNPPVGVPGSIYIADISTGEAVTNRVPVTFQSGSSGAGDFSATITYLNYKEPSSLPIRIFDHDPLIFTGNGFGAAVESGNAPDRQVVFVPENGSPIVIMNNGDESNWNDNEFGVDDWDTANFAPPLGEDGLIYITDANNTQISNAVSVIFVERPDIQSLNGATSLPYYNPTGVNDSANAYLLDPTAGLEVTGVNFYKDGDLALVFVPTDEYFVPNYDPIISLIDNSNDGWDINTTHIFN